jgi:hypothetical protein
MGNIQHSTFNIQPGKSGKEDGREKAQKAQKGGRERGCVNHQCKTWNLKLGTGRNWPQEIA